MNLKSEKGYTGIDIAISVVVIFIFVSLIAILSYNYNSAVKALEYESKATYIAIDEIESIKSEDFSQIEDFRKTLENNGVYVDSTEVEEGFYKRVLVEDYADTAPGKIAGITKKVTVEISYRYKGNVKKVEISTVISK